MNHAEMIQALLDPSLYPDHPQQVEFRQTHISSLFLTQQYVYKLKKPVDFGFLNFTTLEARRFYCQEELRLNRRLAPDTYLRVAEIREADGKLSFDGPGKLLDYAVVMKRLPEEKMLGRLLQERRVSAEDWRQLAAYLAAFHAQAEQNAEITRYGSLEVIGEDWQENFQQTKPFVGKSLSEDDYHWMQQQVERFLQQRKGLFAWRQHTGCIRDCHGDLRIDHICLLDEQIAIFDCIEFNKRFRYTDVAAEIAFLFMDLEYSGFADAAHQFVEEYIGASGDEGLRAMLDFYACYRAYVRGKVESFLLNDPEATTQEQAQALQRAQAYFDLARHYAKRFAFPLVLITSGLTGTGKSTVAKALAEQLALTLLRSDVLRKELAGLSESKQQHEQYGEGIYSKSFTQKTYEALYQRAEQSLLRGQSVLLDASFIRRADRERAQNLAKRLGAAFYLLECVCPEPVVQERLARREEEGRDVSDGRWEIFQRQKEVAEPITEVDPSCHLLVDTAQPLTKLLPEIVQRLTSRPNISKPYPQ